MMMTIQRFHRVLVIVLGMSCASLLNEGCSTVNVTAKQASKADDTFKKTVCALWWGASDPVETVDCGGNGLQIVSVKTSWIYSLCTFITLGAVVPMDVEYRCTSVPLQGGDKIGAVRGTR